MKVHIHSGIPEGGNSLCLERISALASTTSMHIVSCHGIMIISADMEWNKQDSTDYDIGWKKGLGTGAS